MYEHRTHRLLPRRLFLRRLGGHAVVAGSIVAVSLVVGTFGYHEFGGESWLDAFVNASMLLGGMGQVGEVTSESGKYFSAFFSLFSGLILIGVTTVILAPVLHRILHSIHLEDAAQEDGKEG
jgi:hypothetical protein